MEITQAERVAPLLHIVEDDELARKSLARFFESAGHTVHTYATGDEFLRVSPTHACAVLDLQLPDRSGLELQRILLEQQNLLPVVFLTAHGEVPASVQAMKSGAIDFLAKGSDGDDLLRAVTRAIARGTERRSLRIRYESLSPRERDVFSHLISGQLNKQIAFDLGISVQTTKVHRHRVLTKMRADSTVHLSRMGVELGISPVGSVR